MQGQSPYIVNAGLYYQLPPYTALGFKNNHGAHANKYNLRYMKVSQESLGVSWRKGDTFEVSIEGFYKDYDKIPLSVVDGIPLACKGNDYGVWSRNLSKMVNCQKVEPGFFFHPVQK